MVERFLPLLLANKLGFRGYSVHRTGNNRGLRFWLVLRVHYFPMLFTRLLSENALSLCIVPNVYKTCCCLTDEFRG